MFSVLLPGTSNRTLQHTPKADYMVPSAVVRGLIRQGRLLALPVVISLSRKTHCTLSTR